MLSGGMYTGVVIVLFSVVTVLSGGVLSGSVVTVSSGGVVTMLSGSTLVTTSETHMFKMSKACQVQREFAAVIMRSLCAFQEAIPVLHRCQKEDGGWVREEQ